ncbi:MAG TPA: HAD family phosphatase [Actinocrinis sp.]|nr:HAD family phosphatase [Actinocrinis sp.]
MTKATEQMTSESTGGTIVVDSQNQDPGQGSPVQAVLFDLFGVIADTQSPAGQARILSVADYRDAETFWPAYWGLRKSYDASELSGPDYWRAVAAELGTTFTAAQIAELIDADCASWRDVNPAMVALLENLAASGLTIALLSNLPSELADTFEPRNASWLRLMASVGFSCRIGHAKPDAAAFAWSARALGLDPAGILFVDDRADNIEGARAVGMQGHVFTDVSTLAGVIDGARR